MIVNTKTFCLLVLGIVFGGEPQMQGFDLQLITDSLPFNDDDTAATHTVATGGGYLDRAIGINIQKGIEDGVATAVWPDEPFVFSGPLDGGRKVTGYQVLYDGALLFGDKYEIPYTPSFSGDTLVVTPKYKYGNGTPARD